jgi:hypothetical protein
MIGSRGQQGISFVCGISFLFIFSFGSGILGDSVALRWGNLWVLAKLGKSRGGLRISGERGCFFSLGFNEGRGCEDGGGYFCEELMLEICRSSGLGFSFQEA